MGLGAVRPGLQIAEQRHARRIVLAPRQRGPGSYKIPLRPVIDAKLYQAGRRQSKQDQWHGTSCPCQPSPGRKHGTSFHKHLYCHLTIPARLAVNASLTWYYDFQNRMMILILSKRHCPGCGDVRGLMQYAIHSFLALAALGLNISLARAHYNMFLPERHSVKRGERVQMLNKLGDPFY